MDATSLLFGRFPRKVAATASDSPGQEHVFSKGEFDVFVDTVKEKKNVYATISKTPVGGEPVTDKVPFDFDSPVKYSAFGEDVNDCEKIEKMRDDGWLASRVLGSVLSDTKEVAKWAKRRNIPALGVFSGLGIHFYLFYKPKENPNREIKSTNRKLTQELGLETSDTVVAQPERILRVPNCRRVDSEDGETIPCDMWTIPFERDEIIDMTVGDLLEMSREPRELELGSEYDVKNRPEMEVYEDYVNVSRGEIKAKELEDIEETSDAMVNYVLENQITKPCISERVKQGNPDHPARFAFAVCLFNRGYSVEQAVDIIRRLKWIDFEEEKTRKYLKQIYKHGYSEWSCETLLHGKQMCVYSDDPSECPSFMETGQQCQWK